MKKLLVLMVAMAALVGCAGTPSIVAATPRSVSVTGSAFTSSADGVAASLAQAECQKYGRHAQLVKEGGSRASSYWTYDCVN